VEIKNKLSFILLFLFSLIATFRATSTEQISNLWVKCTTDNEGSLSIDTRCVKEQFEIIGRNVLAEESLKEAFKKAHVDPNSIAFNYKDEDASLGSTSNTILCRRGTIEWPIILGLTADEAMEELKVGIRHEISHLINRDHAGRYLAQTVAACHSESLFLLDFCRHQETRADEFAISHTKSPQELTAYAKFLEKFAKRVSWEKDDVHQPHIERAKLFSRAAAKLSAR